jgi:acetylglutamate kinase
MEVYGGNLMDEAQVYEIINKEMENGKKNGCSNEYVVHRILYKIQAYIKEEKHYHKRVIAERVTIYRILAIATSFLVSFTFTGSFFDGVGITATSEGIGMLLHYILERKLD